MRRDTLIALISAILILLWVYAAGSKLATYQEFTIQLKRQPLPVWSISILTWALPAVELGTALLLCFQRTRTLGMLLSLIWMFCFAVYVGLALGGTFGDIPCSCAGIIGSMKWGAHLLFNILFTVLSSAGWYLQRYRKVADWHLRPLSA